jgi:CheY-like chemotaxis protein
MSEVWLDPGAHAVRFHEGAPAAHVAIAEFLTADPRGNDPLLMVARRSTFDGVAALLASGRYGAPIPASRIRYQDVAELVPSVMIGGTFDRARADAAFKTLLAEVRREHAQGTIRFYGEGVDVMCELGDFATALALEEIANDLFVFEPRLSILCGYQRSRFASAAGAPHFRAVCDVHSAVAPMGAKSTRPPQDGVPTDPRDDTGSPAAAVYIIDDDPSIRRSLKRLLSLSALAVRVFESGESFVADLDTLAPGCLVVDIQLGAGMGGLDLLAHMRTTRPTWPALAMSGSDDDNDRLEALRLGARIFLRKPFDPQLLIEAVNQALA